MTTPVSSANSSFYDPNAQLNADGCDPNTASCQPAAPAEASAPREVTIPPVLISGDAGAQQLVKQLDQAQGAPNCSLEAKEATRTCGEAATAGVLGGLAATTVLGAIPGLALAFWEGVECGKDLRAYYDCENP
jgi:hypothetical protein